MSYSDRAAVLSDAKWARSMFVAHPYDFGPEYRQLLDRRFAGSGIELRYANDVILNLHVMEKIRRMMSEADQCFFDVTNCNSNVMFELGYAYGHDEPSLVAVRNDAVETMSSDIAGWDTLRYSDFDNLAELLYSHVTTRMVLMRPATKHLDVIEVHPRDRLRDMRFGIPAVTDPLMMVYAVPENYTRYLKDRSLLGAHPYRAQDLCNSVLAGPNQTGHETFFWHCGFDYASRPGPDYVEVYEGRSNPSQTERVTNFRMYTSGLATYMQRLRVGGADYKPFLYLYMFEQIVEMALVAMADARSKWAFDGQRNISVGALFLNAADLRVSNATPQFYPAGDAGRPVLDGSELWLPSTPLTIDNADLAVQAKELASVMVAELEAHLN